MFDAHCHLDLQPGSPAVAWAEAQTAGLRQGILAGVSPSGWSKQRQLCAELDGLYRTAGIHPWALLDMTPPVIDQALLALEEELENAGTDLVGVGELGLDRSRRLRRRGDLQIDQQIRAFRAQWRLAARHDLPLVLHVVEAHGLALDIARELKRPQRGGMVHSFSGSPELALQWISLGFHLSISPQILNPKAKKIRSAVLVIPPDQLLVETDAPDQASSPAALIDVIACIAKLRGQSPQQIEEQTRDSAHRLFDLVPIA